MAAPVQAVSGTTPSIRLDPVPVVVAASFTAGPLGDVFDFWSAELGVRFDVTFAPYGQVFQQLLDPTGELARNTGGINVVLVRPADLGGAVADLAGAVHAAADRSPAPLLVAVCPPVPDGFVLAVDRPNVVAVTTDGYPVADCQDAYAERVGGIPFTPAFSPPSAPPSSARPTPGSRPGPRSSSWTATTRCGTASSARTAPPASRSAPIARNCTGSWPPSTTPAG